MGHHARPFFQPERQRPFVAVRPLRWKGVQLAPGEEVPAEWPIHHLRHLHSVSMIGPKTHPWTEQRIVSWARRIAAGEERTLAKAERKAAELEARAAAEDISAEEAEEVVGEARSLLQRVGDMFGGGEPGGRSAGDSDTA